MWKSSFSSKSSASVKATVLDYCCHESRSKNCYKIRGMKLIRSCQGGHTLPSRINNKLLDSQERFGFDCSRIFKWKEASENAVNSGIISEYEAILVVSKLLLQYTK
ncbi:hypothetical protein K1719_009097 [Acacia pycnantha]|nr:hypothetical protein K1719_009097 [Acacia pycnantha]